MMQWTLDPTPAKIAAFIASRQELFALRQQHSPYPVRCLLYRYLGGNNRFLAAMRAASPEALLAADSPEVIQAFRREHPYSAYAATPPTLNSSRSSTGPERSYRQNGLLICPAIGKAGA